jgi:hypothetical protein
MPPGCAARAVTMSVQVNRVVRGIPAPLLRTESGQSANPRTGGRKKRQSLC